ncbi:MAG: hypothetical protein EXS08_08775 [Planctomycetes bacterium]|nr:hypothetical protein [Planctomycetota bacterium]
MLPTLEGGIAAVQRRRVLQLWLAILGGHAQVAFFAIGVGALLARVLGRWESGEAAWLLALALGAGATAFFFARRRLPGEASAVSWLDVHSGARGLVVTERELGASDWSARTRDELARSLAVLPPPAWNRALRPAFPALAFAALCVWVPIPRSVPVPPPILGAAALEELEQKLATLEEVLDLPPEEAEELAARLQRIEDEATSGQPASAFEAIDRLGERLDAEAAQALDAAQRAAQDLAQAAGDPSLAEAQAALVSALSGMETAGLGKDLPPELRSALQPGSLSLPAGVQLSSAELAQLSQALKGVLDQRLAQLGAGGLLSSAKLSELRLAQGALGNLDDFEYDPEHVCDEDCKKPGGT